MMRTRRTRRRRRISPGPMEYVYAEVYVLGIPAGQTVGTPIFSPPPCGGRCCPGLFIRVPFGGGNRQRIALVAALAEAYTGNIDPKPVLAVCDDCVSLDAELLGLCLFMKEQTMCTVGDAVHAMIPPAALGRFVRRYRIVPGAAPPDDAAGRMVYDAVAARGSMAYDSLRARFGVGVVDTLGRLTRASCLVIETDLRDPTDQRASLWRLAPALAGRGHRRHSCRSAAALERAEGHPCRSVLPRRAGGGGAAQCS